jgi:hypothetical protein
LEQLAIHIQDRKIEASISSRGKVTCSLDASPMVGAFAGVPSFVGLLGEIKKIRSIAKSLALSVEVIHFAVLWGAPCLSTLSNSIFRGKSMRKLRLYLKQRVLSRDAMLHFGFSVLFDTNFPRVSQHL